MYIIVKLVSKYIFNITVLSLIGMEEEENAHIYIKLSVKNLTFSFILR